jgi:IS5 family transposase
MTRRKKERRTGRFMTVLEGKPKKQELLADPTSKEARRAKALRERKKQKSVYEKARGSQTRLERDQEAGRKGTRHGGPLADKIRKLNQKKAEEGAAPDA